jgi:hypothetical protein
MLYKMIALLLSLHSASGFAAAGVRPIANMRPASNVAMSLSTVEQVGGQLMALAQFERSTDVVIGIGANAPGFGGPEGAYAAYLVAALGIISVASRNGSGGLSPGTGGWDDNKGSSSTGGYAPRLTPGGVEKVRFPPTMGGPERSAAGSGANGILFAGFLPLIIEISRVINLK